MPAGYLSKDPPALFFQHGKSGLDCQADMQQASGFWSHKHGFKIVQMRQVAGDDIRFHAVGRAVSSEDIHIDFNSVRG